MYRSLLVPLDGSLFSEHALPFALAIARRAAASLQVVAVMPNPGILVSTQFVSHLASRWSGYLERMVERIQRCYAGPVSCRVLDGEAVAPTIAAHAEQVEADLVVMTTHGRGTLGRLWFGSVAYEIIRTLSVPVLFVKPHDGVSDWEEPALQHMLIALDGSLAAERVIEPAVSFGTLMNADYVLLRAINDVPFGTPELDSISLSSPALELLDEIRSVQERLQKEAQDYLDRVAEPLRARGLPVQTRVAVASDPATAILQAVAAPGVDLVALETHGSSGSMARGPGRVSRKVIHGITKPILVRSPTAARQNGH